MATMNHDEAAIMTARYARIHATLVAGFNPTHIEIADESAQHAGHAGATAGGETHYRIVLVSEVFTGQSRLARYRAIHAALAAEFASGLHALSLTLQTPEEVAR
jgi:BolA protein